MYLDPSSWGIVVQVLIGTLVAIPVLISIYWNKFKLLFKRSKRGKE